MAVNIPAPDQMTPEAAARALSQFDVPSQVSEEDLAASGIQMPKLGRTRAYRLIYWRKPPVEGPNGQEPGDITFAGAWDGEFVKNVQLGWTPLAKYGTFQDSNPKEPGGMWQPSKDKFRRILRMAGGPEEFTLRQVMEMCHGDVRKLPKGVHFPQLETEAGKAALAGRVRCTMCGRWEKNEQDLYAHQRIKHKEEANVDKQSRALADSIGKSNEPTNNAIQVLADEMTRQAKENAEDRRQIATQLSALAERQASADKRIEALLQVMVNNSGKPPAAEKRGPGRPPKNTPKAKSEPAS